MLQNLQIALDGFDRMLQFEIVSNSNLTPLHDGPSITLTQRNRAQALGSTRNRHGKRGQKDGNRKNMPRRGREF